MVGSTRRRGQLPHRHRLYRDPVPQKLRFVVHDFEDGFDTYTEKPGYSWAADMAFPDVDPAGYVALVIPGGRAPEYIRNDKDFQRIVRHFSKPTSPWPRSATLPWPWPRPEC